MGMAFFTMPRLLSCRWLIAGFCCYLSAVAWPEAHQVRIYRGNFKRHLVAHRTQRYRLALEHFDAIIPRVHLDAAAQWQSRDLGNVADFQLRSLLESCHSDGACLGQPVA